VCGRIERGRELFCVKLQLRRVLVATDLCSARTPKGLEIVGKEAIYLINIRVCHEVRGDVANIPFESVPTG
jgi:hypothetical protein